MSSKQLNESMGELRKLFKEKKYVEAEGLVNSLLNEFKDITFSFTCYLMLANMEIQRGNFEKAITFCDKCSECNHLDIQPYLFKAKCLFNLKKPDAAYKLLEEIKTICQEEYKQNSEYWSILGQVSLELKMYLLAEESAETLSEITRDWTFYSEMCYKIGEENYASGNKEFGFEYTKKGFEIDPYIEKYQILFENAKENNDYNNIIWLYDAYIEISKRDKDFQSDLEKILFTRYEIAHEENDEITALGCCQLYMEKYPDEEAENFKVMKIKYGEILSKETIQIQIAALIEQANVSFYEGDTDGARAIFLKLLNIPLDQEALYDCFINLGEIETAEGNLDAGVFYLQEAIYINSDRHRAYLKLANTFFRTSNYDQAIIFYDLAEDKAEFALDLKEVLLSRALSEFYCKNFLQAEIQAYKAIKAIDTETAQEILEIVAIEAFKSKELEASLQFLSRSIELGPSVTAFENYLKISNEAGRFEDAVRIYDRFFYLSQTNPRYKENLPDVLHQMIIFCTMLQEYRRASDYCVIFLQMFPNDNHANGRLEEIRESLKTLNKMSKPKSTFEIEVKKPDEKSKSGTAAKKLDVDEKPCCNCSIF